MSIDLKKFGFDLDNTIIDYSASVEKYCSDNRIKSCKTINDLRILLHDTDQSGHRWQIAQGWLYTDGLSHAKPADGVIDLCKYLKARNYELFIVSHKTTHTPDFCGQKPLRDIASTWISSGDLSNYFDDTVNIFYEPSRKLKIERIKSLKLHFFVDDLVHVFRDPDYPRKIVSFLLSSNPTNLSWIRDVTSFASIKEIVKNEY